MKKLLARDIMNEQVVTVTEDMSLEEVATFLTDREISGAPVVNDRGTMVGVISLSDIAGGAAEGGDVLTNRYGPEMAAQSWEDSLTADEVEQLHVEYGGQKVADLMTPTVYTIPEDTPIAQIAKTMVAGRLHRLFVSRGGRVAGIITTLDLLQVFPDS